ncbi:MAG: hypothetical protein V3R96_02855 [Dehalococcoidales bacterium]
MAKRRVSVARSRAGKRAYKSRQRKSALNKIGLTLAGFIPGVGSVLSVHSLNNSINKFRRNS